MNIPQLDNTYVANTYARFPVTIARGKGSLVWDADDKVYIDMATGIAVNSFGIADPAWIRAVTEQLCTVQHASNLYYTAPDAQLAQLLCEKTGMKKVFFSNSGAEANECAIKAARKYAADHKGPECPGLSLGTVYRNLNSLVEAGMVRRVSIPGRADRFDHTLCWHSHLYCTACGGVVDADVDEKQVMRLVRRQKDVVVQDCAVVLFGLCEACAKKQAEG